MKYKLNMKDVFLAFFSVVNGFALFDSRCPIWLRIACLFATMLSIIDIFVPYILFKTNIDLYNDIYGPEDQED